MSWVAVVDRLCVGTSVRHYMGYHLKHGHGKHRVSHPHTSVAPYGAPLADSGLGEAQNQTDNAVWRQIGEQHVRPHIALQHVAHRSLDKQASSPFKEERQREPQYADAN